MESWLFLLIGSFAAIGAALALGTAAALVRYYRTGSFPAQSPDTEVRTGQVVALWARVVVGVVLAIAGVASLASQDLLTL